MLEFFFRVSLSCRYIIFLEPVVQSIVSLTISLRHKFVKQISAKVTNTLLFFAEKCENPLHTPFIQLQQTRKGLPNADINNCIAGIHKVSKHKQIAFKLFLFKMCLCRADAK